MKKGLSLFLAISLLVLHMVCFGSVFAAGEDTEIPVYLSDLTPASVQTGWGDLHKDENLEGAVLSLNNAGARQEFAKGLCVHAESEVSYDISGYDVIGFKAALGMDDGSYGYKDYAGSSFEVLADGVTVYTTGGKSLKISDAIAYVDIEIPAGTTTLTLKNGHGDDGSTWSEHCNWCDARIILDPSSKGLLDTVELGAPKSILYVGETLQLTATPKSVGGTEMSTGVSLSYTTSDSTVATISSAGLLTATGEGNVTVTVTASKDGRGAEDTFTLQCISENSTSSFLLNSPEGSLQVLLQNSDAGLTYTVVKDGVTAVEASPVGYTTQTVDFTRGLTFDSKTAIAEVNDTYRNYSGDYAYGNDHYNGQSVTFRKDGYLYTVLLRAYEDGYALRSAISKGDGTDGTLTVTDDKTAVKFPSGTTLWASQISSRTILKGHSYETGFPTVQIESTEGLNLFKAPLARVNESLWVLVSEAEVYGDLYIGSIFKGIGDNTLEYTAGPVKTTENGVTSAEIDAYTDEELAAKLAEIELVDISVEAGFTFPWRYGVVGNLADIVESDLTDNLCKRTTGDFSWVQPGVTAWMWLTEGHSGQHNPETIRKYVDLASEMGWKYLLLDEGWQPSTSNGYEGYYKDFDDLLAYAESKGVSFLVWSRLADLDTAEKRERLADWASKGIAGVKFDFVEAECLDRMQTIKDIYEKCAEEHLLINVHGANIPTGERSTWPNVINREAVKGQEYGGVWCSDSTVWPYTRAAVGPTDITPKLEETGTNTVSHMLALNIVVESGMPCMASAPEIYYKSNAKYLLQNLPAAWDDLQFIDGYPSRYTVLARQKGDNWYVGGITLSATTATFTLDFLGEGNYVALIYSDSTRESMKVEKTTVARGDALEISMLDGGGFSVMLIPEEDFVAADTLIAEESILSLEEGKTGQLTLTVSPEGVNLKELCYSSSDTSVVTVDQNGLLTAVGQGVATVTAELPSSGVQTTVEVRVYAAKTYTLSSDWTLVNGNQEYPLKAGTNAYSVRMPLIYGDIQYDSQNLYLQEAPSGDFTLTVKVQGGLSANFESVGLVAYAGKDKMVMMARRFHSYLGNNIFCLSTHESSFNEKSAQDTNSSADAYLRLERIGDTFYGSYSYDGVNYTAISQSVTNANVTGAEDLKIGLIGLCGTNYPTSPKTIVMSDYTMNGERIPFCVEEDLTVFRVRKGETVQLVAGTVLGTAGFDELDYTISDSSIATVDANGMVTGIKSGVTRLLCVNAKGETATYQVEVYGLEEDTGYGPFTVVNPQSGKMPTVVSDYVLTMKTLTGDINGQPKNLVLTNAPEGDFTITVKISGGLTSNFQSIGLVAYADSGKMVTMERRYHSYFGGNVFCASTSINGSYTENRTADTDTTADAWVKLTKQGNVFTGAFSFDGTSWTEVSPITNAQVGEATGLKIGLIARTGTYQAEVDATYSDFTLNDQKIAFVQQDHLCQLLVPEMPVLNVGDALPTLPSAVTGYYESGKKETVTVLWNTEDFHSDAAGVYTLIATEETTGLTAEVQVRVVLKGDLNGDNAVSIADVAVLLDILAGADVQENDISADLNGDGAVSIGDVTELLDLLSDAG